MLYTVMCIIMYGGGACHGQEILLGLPVSEAYMEDGVCRITDRFSIQQAAAMALFVPAADIVCPNVRKS